MVDVHSRGGIAELNPSLTASAPAWQVDSFWKAATPGLFRRAECDAKVPQQLSPQCRIPCFIESFATNGLNLDYLRETRPEWWSPELARRCASSCNILLD